MSKEHESGQPPLTLEEVAYIGMETMLSEGQRVPIWVFAGRNTLHTLAHDDLLLPNEFRLSEIYQVGVALSQNDQIDHLEHVYLVTEGWMRKVGAGKGVAVYYAEGEDRTDTVRVSHAHIPTNTRESVEFEVIWGALGEWHRFKPRTNSETDSTRDNPYVRDLLAQLVKGYTDGKRTTMK